MKRRVLKFVVGVFVAAVLLGGLALGGIAWSIHSTVRENCRIAQRSHPHPGNDVAALVEFVQSGSHSLWDRNHVGVWTLGRLRAAEALPTLESHYTGEGCDHDNCLCQHELEKAIKRCGGSPDPSQKSSG